MKTRSQQLAARSETARRLTETRIDQSFPPQVHRRLRGRGRRRPGARIPVSRSAIEVRGGAEHDARPTAEVNAWVVIRPDETCVIRIARSEMGQGTLTGLAQLVAEELECDWKNVTTEVADPRPEPRAQARLGRDGHGRQPRHTHVRGLRPARRRRRAHDAAAGGGRRLEGAGQRAHRLRRRDHARADEAHDHLRQGGGRRGEGCPRRIRRASRSRIRRTGRSPASR